MTQLSGATGNLNWGHRIDCGTAGSSCYSKLPNGNMGAGGLFVYNGNAYIAGTTTGTVSLSNDGTTAGYLGIQNLFFLIFSSTGGLQNGVQFGDGSTTPLYMQSAVSDSTGNLIVSGNVGGTSILGATEYGAVGNSDAFIIKFNSSAGVSWISEFGGGGGSVSGASIQNANIQPDTSGNFVLTANYSSRTAGAATYASAIASTPSIPSAMYGTAAGTGTSVGDGIILQVSPRGTLNWVAQLGAGATNDMNLNNVAVGAGAIFVMGEISPTSTNVSPGGAGTLLGAGDGTANLILTGISVLGPH